MSKSKGKSEAELLEEIRGALRCAGFSEASVMNSPASCVRMLVNDERRRIVIDLYSRSRAAGLVASYVIREAFANDGDSLLSLLAEFCDVESVPKAKADSQAFPECDCEVCAGSVSVGLSNTAEELREHIGKIREDQRARVEEIRGRQVSGPAGQFMQIGKRDQ